MTRTSGSRARSAREAREIVFTSGGTEASNLALKGAAWAGKARGHRIVTTPVEHHAVGHTLDHLQKFGFEVVEVPVDRYGRVDPADVERGDHRPDDPGHGDARQQRGRHDPAGRRGRARSSAPTAGCCSTSTPSRRRPWLDLDVNALGRRPRRAGRAQGRGPEGHRARCGSGAAPTSSPSSTAARRSATGARAPRTSPAPSAWRRRSSCAPPSEPTLVPEVRARRDRPGRGPGRRSTASSRPATPPSGCRTSRRSSSAAPTAARSRSPSTSRASLHRPAPRAPAGPRTSATCCPRWAIPPEEARGALRLSLGRTTTDAEIAEVAAIVPAVIERLRAAELAAEPAAAAPGRSRHPPSPSGSADR